MALLHTPDSFSIDQFRLHICRQPNSTLMENFMVICTQIPKQTCNRFWVQIWLLYLKRMQLSITGPGNLWKIDRNWLTENDCQSRKIRELNDIVKRSWLVLLHRVSFFLSNIIQSVKWVLFTSVRGEWTESVWHVFLPLVNKSSQNW